MRFIATTTENDGLLPRMGIIDLPWEAADRRKYEVERVLSEALTQVLGAQTWVEFDE